MNIIKDLPSFSTLISLAIDTDPHLLEPSEKLAIFCFEQHFPILQRLYLYGSIYNQNLSMMSNIRMFPFPSLLYIHVSQVHYMMAIHILNQCSQLRSFSTKLCGYRRENDTTMTSILMPTRIAMGLTTITNLSLGEDNCLPTNALSSTLLELLLPCCPNLHTFSFYYQCRPHDKKLMDPDWWTTALASNKKLKRISLQFYMNGIRNALNEQVVQKFRSLPFFAELNVEVAYTIKRIEFPRMIHIYSIKTKCNPCLFFIQ